jgi:hypothetical protein
VLTENQNVRVGDGTFTADIPVGVAAGPAQVRLEVEGRIYYTLSNTFVLKP